MDACIREDSVTAGGWIGTKERDDANVDEQIMGGRRYGAMVRQMENGAHGV